MLPGWFSYFPRKLELVREIRGLTSHRVGLNERICLGFRNRKLREADFVTLDTVSGFGCAGCDFHAFEALQRKGLCRTRRDFFDSAANFVEISLISFVGNFDGFGFRCM